MSTQHHYSQAEAILWQKIMLHNSSGTLSCYLWLPDNKLCLPVTEIHGFTFFNIYFWNSLWCDLCLNIWYTCDEKL